jgi:SSS family solute:Na+ symporter
VTHVLPITIIVIYIVGLFSATWWARRLSERGGGGLLGYLLAGRQLPAWVAAALLAGLAVGGVSTIGTAERAYTHGLSAGWYNAAWAAAALVVGLVAARRYRRLQATTLPELFERYYSTRARVLGVIGQLVIQIVITALQYVAGGAILHSLVPELLSLTEGMLVSAVVFLGITVIGGFWAAGLTNVINVAVIYVGLILGAGLTLDEVGGFAALVERLPPGHPGFDLGALGLSLVTAWFVVMITQAHSTQSVIQIGFAARDERAAGHAYLLGGLVILPVGFIAAVIGVAAAGLHPGIEPATALPRVVLGLSPFAAGIVLSGLWAADVSTASALLIGSSTLVTSDIIERFFAPDMDPRRQTLVSRITILVLSVVTFLLALTVVGILKVLLIGLTLATAYTLVILMTMYAPRLCRRSSASWTLGTTMVVFAMWLTASLVPAWSSVLATLPHPIYFTWAVSLATFFLVALFDKRPIPA